MTFLDEAQKARDEDSPFFKADVLKEYTFQFVGARKLTKKDKLYKEVNERGQPITMWELSLLDLKSGKEKLWTTSSSQLISEMIDQRIGEGCSFIIKKTGETGKGKKYWIIKKIAEKDGSPALNPAKEDEEVGEPYSYDEENKS